MRIYWTLLFSCLIGFAAAGAEAAAGTNAAPAKGPDTGGFNTTNGDQALASNMAGARNTALGAFALTLNTAGNFNTAVGHGALFHNTLGSENIALGFNAGLNLSAGDLNIDIGAKGAADDANIIRLGETQTNTFIAGIHGTPVPGGLAVFVRPGGQLGVLASSARFKQNIRSMGPASESLFSLRPVTFQYRPDIDPQQAPQFGLVAEEVAQVDSNLVARDERGRIFSVRYEAVNAMLLNEFLKEHQKVGELGAEIAALKRQSVALEQLRAENQSLAQRLSRLESILAPAPQR